MMLASRWATITRVRGLTSSVSASTTAANTPTDATQIPTGQLASVKGTPFDFTPPTAIGAHVTANDPQLLLAHGYDHNWVINRGTNPGLVQAAKAVDPKTGRTLTVSTTEPGVQFYTSNFIEGAFTGTSGHVYRQGAGCDWMYPAKDAAVSASGDNEWAPPP
jgi:galactose mutarotase-like enzyme